MTDKYSEQYMAKHPVREGALTATITERVTELALPKHKYVKPRQKPLVKKEALKYEATPRISELAKPMKPIRKWKKKRPVWVKNKKALTCKATKRVESLAKPNPRQNPPCKDPFAVVPAALTAGCNLRTRRLAKPKPIHTEVLEHPINPKWMKNPPKDDDDEDED